MGMTIAEKIIARAAGLETVHAGEIHTVTLDYLMSNDGTTHLTIDMSPSRNPAGCFSSSLRNPAPTVFSQKGKGRIPMASCTMKTA